MAVTELGLPTRALNSLQRRGISTIGQLIERSAEDLQFYVQGLGPGGIKEIKAALARQGLSLAASRNRSASKDRPVSRHVQNHQIWQRPEVEPRAAVSSPTR
ncbi:DNA-directed RNA polymerase subunit alpha C-terminal domain-containing protein [Paenarthrobacter sp. NPDC056912]|uniref:DNA-directed RNA polymerase subunit alpha C-terminal domain-containing protein n=1 Tax=Paenarthrobacter sp. NPDC056912 TaxID=3345965 RepID=UPI00366C1B1B